jgi:rod shape-determining protein MreC
VLRNLTAKSKKERAVHVIVPLLVIQFVLLSIQSQNPDGMAPIKTLFFAVQAPIINISSDIIKGIGSIYDNYIGLQDVRDDNEKLKRQVRELEMENRSLEEIRQENIRLRRLLSMKDNIEYETIEARVIARNPEYLLSDVLYINRGANDGLKIDSPVLSGDGIIGRTVFVSERQSQVQLITNPDASIGAMLDEERTLGVLSGTGKSLLDLKYISSTKQIQTGDIVKSSGLDGIFPKGFLLGNIVDVQKNKEGFYTIKVQPAADLYHIEEVSVLLMNP